MPLLQDLWKDHFSSEAKLKKKKEKLESTKRELELTKEINILNQEIDVQQKEIQEENDRNLVKHNIKKDNEK